MIDCFSDEIPEAEEAEYEQYNDDYSFAISTSACSDDVSFSFRMSH